ncbi:MAG: serine/threonine protein kinase [Chromatiaceae bacterium]|nr:serine/threonine protein kinase [Chromatiaceae bacterium]
MSHPYESLTPDLILDAVAAAGLDPDGHLLALNSYENRVFQVGVEGQAPLVAKFYRPDRWTDQQIVEEHDFSHELAAAEIPVVAPWRDASGESLLRHGGFRFSLFPRRGGRAPEPGDLDQLEWIGRFIGRIHLAGQARPFAHRPNLDVAGMGWTAREEVLNSPLLPRHERAAYATISEQLLTEIEHRFAAVDAARIRLHGDCHHGNILWTDLGPHFVDLDDCRNGPAIQDLWMLLHGDRTERTLQLSAMLDGYRLFHDLDLRELAMIEPLRGLRLVHYSGWLAKRWPDPAFPAAFPWAASDHYWSQHVQDLREQLAELDLPPLVLY